MEKEEMSMNKLNKNKAFCKIISHRIFINLGDSLFYPELFTAM